MEFKSELKKGYQNTPDALGTDGMHFEYYVRYGKERYNFKIHSIFTNSRERGIEFLSDVTAEIINEGLLGNYHLYKPHLQDG
ncbi:MAG: hypothetical protein MI748_07690 [Opitutales bacterium]|nr:hypothetical protein [Opitutales bacterium]